MEPAVIVLLKIAASCLYEARNWYQNALGGWGGEKAETIQNILDTIYETWGVRPWSRENGL